MPLTRFALLLCYVVITAGLTIFVFAQLQPNGDTQSSVAVLLPLAMVAGLVIRRLHKRLERNADK